MVTPTNGNPHKFIPQSELDAVIAYTKENACSVLWLTTDMELAEGILRLGGFLTWEMASLLGGRGPVVLNGDHVSLERHFWECKPKLHAKLIRNGEVVESNYEDARKTQEEA